MKGMIFTELIEFLERHTSMSVAELIIRDAGLDNDGAFTSVGNYPHFEAIKLVGSAANHLGLPAHGLLRQFGNELFARLVESHSQFLADGVNDAFSFLAKIQNHIHVEVAKLYPDTKPPTVNTTIEDDTMTVHYESHRPFAMIAMGLIEGCCTYFGNSMIVRLHGEQDEATTQAIFSVSKTTKD